MDYISNTYTSPGQKKEDGVYIEHGIVLTLPNLQVLQIQLEILNSFKFSCPFVRNIVLFPSFTDPSTVDNSTLKNLAPWNSTLTNLTVNILVKTIPDFAFIWTPLIVVLDLKQNDVKFLSNNTFFGLNFLEELILARNALNNVPSHTFHAFQYQSLRNLDLSFNGIITIPSDAFCLITSLKHLNLAGNPIVVSGNLFDELSNLISLNLDDLFIDAESSSLQILRVRTISPHTSDICSLFPNLTHLASSASWLSPLPIPPASLALSKCLHLEYLDLSDSTQSWDFGTRNSTLPRLQTFKIAGNQLNSLKEVYIVNQSKPNISGS